MDVDRAKNAILKQEDTNQDFQVTVEDTGPKLIRLGTVQSNGITKTPIHGNYMISSLLQELAIQTDPIRSSAINAGHLIISEAKLRENPVDKLLRMIHGRFWPALVRELDANGLQIALMDSKNHTGEQQPRIYVPEADKIALRYYRDVAKSRPELDLDVQTLPAEITPVYVASIRDKPGMLSLAMTIFKGADGKESVRGTPFVVPGGRFNEMYGWDSYFCALGLLEHPDQTGYYLYIAKSMTDNLAYEIQHYGKILNANRSYYLTRSQPPFLAAMVTKVSAKIDEFRDSVYTGLVEETGYIRLLIEGQMEWIESMVKAAVKEYWQVWMAEPRFLPQFGLSRYYDNGIGIPMETEPSHYEAVLKGYAKKWDLCVLEFIQAYNSGQIKEPELDEYFLHDRSLRESGHDTTYRFEGKTADLLTVDLNALLYRYEVDVSSLIERHFDGEVLIDGVLEKSEDWLVRAEARKHRMYVLMWDKETGLWYDYDFVRGEQSEYESVTSLWTLWAGLVSPSDALVMRDKSLGLFEVAGGLVAGTERSRGPISLLRPNRQWDYPYGWAPHQLMAWEGLEKYGFKADTRRLVYHWLYMITKSFADYNGVVPEKFDVVARSHKVTAEYGNVGVDFKMVPREGFGWMNASYQIGISLLSRSERRSLELLIPPERLFP